MGFHVDVASVRIYAEWRVGFSSDRPTAVFLHDGLGSVQAWGETPQRICGPLDWNALLYDRRGYGQSSPREDFPDGFLEEEAQSLGTFLDRLGLERVHLIGHSDGASIALLFAAARPERVLSLLAAAPHTFVEREAQEGIFRHLAPAGGEAPDWLIRQHGERAQTLLETWAQRWTSQQQFGWDMRPQLAKISCPTLVIQGDRDEFATLAQVEAILEGVPDSTSWIVPSCGHVPHAEAPEEFVRRALEFLRGIQKRG